MLNSNVTTLKIIIVAGPNDEDYIRRNINLIEKLNPHSNFSVDVIDNGFMINPKSGIHSTINARVLLGHRPFNEYPDNAKASYQHAAALNSYFYKYKNEFKFNLVLDPDFYITRRNWIVDLLRFMQEKDLSIFGSSWAPCWYNKYRDFPSVHCMLINANSLDPVSFDFSPELMDNKQNKLSRKNIKKKKIETPPTLRKSKPALIKITIKNIKRMYWKYKRIGFHLLRFLKVLTSNRSLIGASKDTGYRIYEQLYNKVNHSILVSNIKNTNNFNLPHLNFRIGRYIEEYLPVNQSYLPKKGSFIRSEESLYTDLAGQDLLELGYEEFMFDNSRFAFHIRRFNKINRSREMELEIIDRIILSLDH